MDFGVVTLPANIRLCADVGFAFVELPVPSGIEPATTDDAWAAKRGTILSAGLPTPVCNQFFPADARLVGAERDHDAALAHAERVLSRLQSLGGTIVVFGSGKARMAPAGYPLDRARDELVDLARRIGERAEQRGMVIAMEHLRRAESNLLNTVRETLDFVRRVNHPAVRLLIDSYHVAQENEGLDVVAECRRVLAHVHVADPVTRREPTAATDLRPFFRALKEIDYAGRVSLECAWAGWPGALGPTRELLSRQWQEA